MEKITREDVLNDNDLKGHFYGSNYNPFVVKLFEKFSLYKDHPTTASGSVATPKEDTERIFSGSPEEILDSLESTDDAYYHHSQLESVISLLQSELTSLRQQLKEREESIKELLEIIENSPELWLIEKQWQAISRAKALLDKQ